MVATGRSLTKWVSRLIAMAAVMGASSASALTSPTESIVEFSPPVLEQQAAVTNLNEAPLVTPDEMAMPVSYSVCSESLTWTRPTADEQHKALQANPRYSSLPSESTQPWQQSFWEKDVIAFTTYGLSARQEPIYFSGLWSLLEQQPVWEQCYDAEKIAQLNSGEIAELWLIGYQVKSMQWVGGRYLLTVEPTDAGAQFVQFPRREAFVTLPLQIVTEDNNPLEFVSADYLTPL